MPYAERIVPADSDILCESCGYTLNGLPNAGNCPECGTPIAESTVRDGRSLSEYELNPRPETFIRTTWRVIFDTKRFYRTLRSRENINEARKFANYHRYVAAALFSLSAAAHAWWMFQASVVPTAMIPPQRLLLLSVLAVAWSPIALWLLVGVTNLAQWLTSLEARFWGMRLPLPVVRRAMQFHAANYLPVGMVAAFYTWGFAVFRWMPDTWYLYGLCALVVLSALYLFKTYWIAMKSLMFANR